jgi:hypothetical protein
MLWRPVKAAIEALRTPIPPFRLIRCFVLAHQVCLPMKGLWCRVDGPGTGLWPVPISLSRLCSCRRAALTAGGERGAAHSGD